jgi:hypothetical protein
VDNAGLTIRPHLASATSAAAPAVRRPVGGRGFSCDARQARKRQLKDPN